MQTLLLAALVGLAVTCSAQNTSAPVHNGIAHEAEAATFTFHTTKERTNLTASPIPAPLVTAVSMDSDEAQAMGVRVRGPAPAPATTTAVLMAAQPSGAADAPTPAQVVPVPASAPSQQLSEGLSGALDPARARSTINSDAATSQHGPATAAAVGGQSPATPSAADESPDIHSATPESDAQQNSPPVSAVTTVSDTMASPVAGAAVSTSHAPAIAASILVVVALVAGSAGAVIWRRRRARQYSNLRDTEMALRTPHEM